MDHRLAGTEIRLTYLQDRRALTRIDWALVFDDLTDAGAPPNRCQWADLDGLTHVVLATCRDTGHYIGLLGLTERRSGRDSWLLIEAAMARREHESVLLRVMLVHVLARIVCLDGKPAALAASPRDREAVTTLRALGGSINGAALYPEHEAEVISLAAAALARRIGPGANVLDLRRTAETSLSRDLRRLHRIRTEPPKSLPRGPAPGKRSRSGAATRRPRTATHTGKSG